MADILSDSERRLRADHDRIRGKIARGKTLSNFDKIVMGVWEQTLSVVDTNSFMPLKRKSHG